MDMEDFGLWSFIVGIVVICALLLTTFFCFIFSDKDAQYYYVSPPPGGAAQGGFQVILSIDWCGDPVAGSFSTWQEAVEACKAMNESLASRPER